MSLLRNPTLYISRILIGRPYRASRHSNVICFRTYHVPTSPESGQGALPLSKANLDRVSGTWFIPDPKNTDYNAVVAQLPQLLPSRRQHLNSALFLVTPKLAQWFDGRHPFHQEAINHIYQPISADHPLESVVAVVDALPCPSKSQPAGELPFPGCEGIALCLLPDQIPSSPTSEAQHEQALIRFHSVPGTLHDETWSMVSATLPTANTLFVNGSTSTMFKQEWAQVNEGEQKTWAPKNSSVNLASLSVPILRSPSNFALYEIPLQPLTPARKIVTSMGNVLRELEGDDGKSTRASTELESVVPEYVKEKEAQGLTGSVKVFALVMPPTNGSLVQDQLTQTAIDPDQTEYPKSFTVSRTASEQSISGSMIRDALHAGGRIIRVTGGGGGWGKKQGLLSLDPKVDFGDDEPVESSMFPSFEDELSIEAGTAPQELLPLGHSIQFFAAWLGSCETDYLDKSGIRESPASNFTARQWSRTLKHKWILGTTVSNEEALTKEDAVVAKCKDVYCLDKHFGMLSQSGLCLAHETVRSTDEVHKTQPPDYQTIHQFRIDVPYAVLRSTWVGPSTSEEDGSSGGGEEQKVLNPIQGTARISGGSTNETEGTLAENVIRKQRIHRRSASGRLVRLQKYLPPVNHKAQALQSLQPGKPLDGEFVPGFENLDGRVRLHLQEGIDRPDLDHTIRVHTTRYGGSNRASRQGTNELPHARAGQDQRNQATYERRSPNPAVQHAELESSDGINPGQLDSYIRLREAPNGVSWDRPRANVKPGRSPQQSALEAADQANGQFRSFP